MRNVNNIKTRRQELGMTLEEVAIKAGCSTQNVALLEGANPSCPSLRLARGLSAALRTSLNKLFPIEPLK